MGDGFLDNLKVAFQRPKSRLAKSMLLLERECAIKSAAKNKSRIVFMGDSITEEWARLSPDFFQPSHYINRG